MGQEPSEMTDLQLGDVQVRGVHLNRGNLGIVADWCGGQLVCAEGDASHMTCHIDLKQLDGGVSELYIGDWVAKVGENFVGAPDSMVRDLKFHP